ncbi:MAG: hypothetical protein K6T74_06825 [Geminicoccaceae bacterium]|nr:hypothetical protein [Geminicoccaceae bacterium]
MLPVAAEAARLSGRVVGQLAPAEQFLLWALRRRTTDGGATSPVLVHGFRLAFGLALVEPALAAFERFCALVEAEGLRDQGLLPLACPCVSADEQRLLAILLAPRPAIAEALARLVVAAAAVDRLVACARELARLLERADLLAPGPSERLHRAARGPVPHICERPKFSMPIFSMSSSSVRFWS